MDHLVISNTVDSKGGLGVAGVATTDMSSCSVFSSLVCKMQLRKLATNIFDCALLILGFYLSLQKERMSFSIYELKVCSVLYNLLYQFSHFPVSMEDLKLQKQKLP